MEILLAQVLYGLRMCSCYVEEVVHVSRAVIVLLDMLRHLNTKLCKCRRCESNITARISSVSSVSFLQAARRSDHRVLRNSPMSSEISKPWYQQISANIVLEP
jgi:hypothetical protein